MHEKVLSKRQEVSAWEFDYHILLFAAREICVV